MLHTILLHLPVIICCICVLISVTAAPLILTAGKNRYATKMKIRLFLKYFLRYASVGIINDNDDSEWVYICAMWCIGVRAGGLQSPPELGKTIFFRQLLDFFGQKTAAKNEKNIHTYFLSGNIEYLFCPVKWSVRIRLKSPNNQKKPDKTIKNKTIMLQCKKFQLIVFGKVRWAVFQALSKYFSGNDVSPPPQKILARTSMIQCHSRDLINYCH